MLEFYPVRSCFAFSGTILCFVRLGILERGFCVAGKSGLQGLRVSLESKTTIISIPRLRLIQSLSSLVLSLTRTRSPDVVVLPNTAVNNFNHLSVVQFISLENEPMLKISFNLKSWKILLFPVWKLSCPSLRSSKAFIMKYHISL